MKLQHALLAICIVLAFSQIALAGSYRWNFAEGEVYTTPLYDSGTLFVASYNGYLYAVNPSTGTEIWPFNAGSPIDVSPSIASGIIIIGAKDGHVYAVNETDGTEVWSFNGTQRVNGVLATNSLAYVATSGAIYAFERSNGVLRWNVSADKVTTGIGASSSNIYFGSGDDLVALDARNGFERWRLTTGKGWKAAPEYAENLVYYGSTDQQLHTVDALTGEEKWTVKTEGWVESGVTEQNGVIYFGSDDYSAYAVDAKSGGLIWKSKLTDAVTTKPLIILPSAGTSIVIVGSNDGVVHGLSAATGEELWRINVGTRFFSPAEGNGLIVMGGKGGLFALSETGCSIDFPSDGDSIPKGIVFVRGTARAKSGVRTVGVNLNDQGFVEASGTNKWSYVLDASNLSTTNLAIECKVTDNNGNDEELPFTTVNVVISANATLPSMNVANPGVLLPGGKFIVNVTDAKYGEPVDDFTVTYQGKTFQSKNGEAELVAEGDGFQHFVVSKRGYLDADGYLKVNGNGGTTLIFGVVLVIIIAAGAYFLFRKPANRPNE